MNVKGADNRDRIVAAALDLFMERGYAETSIGDVAETAGLLKGNLSYYFKTKASSLASDVPSAPLPVSSAKVRRFPSN